MRTEPIFSLRLRLILGFTLIALSLGAQTKLITFRGRLMDKMHPIRNAALSGRVEAQAFVSDSNGEFHISIAISPGQREVKMLLLEEDWNISYPINGQLTLPRDENSIVEIYLARNDGNEYDRQQQLIRELEAIKNQLSEESSIDEALAAFGSSQLNALDQQFLKAIDQQMRIRDEIKIENDRRSKLLAEEQAVSLQKGRLETRNLLNAVIDHFITRSKDLKDDLQFKGKKVFQRDWIVMEIGKTIDAYSEAYEELNRNRNKILNMVSTYWPEDYPKLNQTEQLLQFALDDLHKTTALSATPLIHEINDFNQGKGSNKRRKQELLSDIESLAFKLSKEIDTLTDRKSKVFQLLQQN